MVKQHEVQACRMVARKCKMLKRAMEKILSYIPKDDSGTFASNIRRSFAIHIGISVFSIAAGILMSITALLLAQFNIGPLHLLLSTIMTVGLIATLGLYVFLGYRILAILPKYNLLSISFISLLLILQSIFLQGEGWIALAPNLVAVLVVASLNNLLEGQLLNVCPCVCRRCLFALTSYVCGPVSESA